MQAFLAMRSGRQVAVPQSQAQAVGQALVLAVQVPVVVLRVHRPQLGVLLCPFLPHSRWHLGGL